MRFYTEGQWAGRANYQCEMCAYSTLRKDRMEAHIDGRHPGGYTVALAPAESETTTHDQPLPPSGDLAEEDDTEEVSDE